MENKDFVDETLIDFEIEGRKFKYKPITTGDELEWAPEYIEKGIPNLKKLTLCQMRSIVEVPYTKDDIKIVIGIDKEFKDLTNEEKGLFWEKINPTLGTKIIKKLKELSSDSEVKKN